jgi:hypothetical protein
VWQVAVDCGAPGPARSHREHGPIGFGSGGVGARVICLPPWFERGDRPLRRAIG